MSNKELIEEVTVSDRTSSMTNPRTNDSLKTAEAVGEGCLQGSRPNVVIVPEKKKALLHSGKNGVGSHDVSSR